MFSIQILQPSDIDVIIEAFIKSRWNIKTKSLFEKYLQEQQQGIRICYIAYLGEQFTGYVTLKWKSEYPYFATHKIPEISDLNVLPFFRSQGIGSALLDKCENTASSKTNFVGIGVGWKGLDFAWRCSSSLHVDRFVTLYMCI